MSKKSKGKSKYRRASIYLTDKMNDLKNRTSLSDNKIYTLGLKEACEGGYSDKTNELLADIFILTKDLEYYSSNVEKCRKLIKSKNLQLDIINGDINRDEYIFKELEELYNLGCAEGLSFNSIDDFILEYIDDIDELAVLLDISPSDVIRSYRLSYNKLVDHSVDVVSDDVDA